MTFQLQTVKWLGKSKPADVCNGIISIGEGIQKDQRTESQNLPHSQQLTLRIYFFTSLPAYKVSLVSIHPLNTFCFHSFWIVSLDAIRFFFLKYILKRSFKWNWLRKLYRLLLLKLAKHQIILEDKQLTGPENVNSHRTDIWKRYDSEKEKTYSNSS